MGVSDFFDEFEKDRIELLSKLSPAEAEVRGILEDWFGECIEYMEDSKEVEKYILQPIYKVLKKYRNE